MLDVPTRRDTLLSSALLLMAPYASAASAASRSTMSEAANQDGVARSATRVRGFADPEMDFQLLRSLGAANYMGAAVGDGIFVNYALAVVWSVDAITVWRRPVPRLQLFHTCVTWFVAFIMLNATVVFGPPFWKVVGTATIVALLVVAAVSRRAAISSTPSVP